MSQPAPAPAQRREFVHPEASHAKKKGPSAFAIEPINAFYAFLAAGLLSALFAPIQDCDETFNYWEPTHYISHGYGLQTWEYSPEFSIRSWTYILFHAIIGNFRRLLPHSTKVSEFYFIRYVLAFICALCQVCFFRVVSFTLNSRIGLFFLLATITSPGNFHASAAFLPSSFAMYASLLGAAAFMNWRGGVRTTQGIVWFAAGGIFGWPFAAALCFPFLVEEALFMITVLGNRDRTWEAILRIANGGILSTLLLLGDTLVNTFFYKKVVTVPWNIVKYNIFSSTGGPDLYGTEPWTFYFRNLLINFNIWFILAMAALPLFMVQKIANTKKTGLQSGLRTIVFLAPFYMWLAIFTLQPHKEERFIYPAYPFLALNAAMALHIVLSTFGNSDPKSLVGKIPAKFKLTVVVATLLFSFDLGLARVIGVYQGYSAPLSLYKPLGAGVAGQQGVGTKGDNVCFGKEWYRFPSSYFLPRDMHAKFIRSEFRGLLPGEFSEAQMGGFGFWSGTWLPTTGLNDRNQEDMSKYVDIRQCSFLVDTRYPLRTDPLPPREPDYVADTDNWQIVKCEPFLDAANTHLLARVLWVPDLPFVPEKFRRRWGQHCLLRKKQK